MANVWSKKLFHTFFQKTTINICTIKNKAVPLHPISRKQLLNITKNIAVSNGIKAITSDFGSEDLGSIPGWTTFETIATRQSFHYIQYLFS